MIRLSEAVDHIQRRASTQPTTQAECVWVSQSAAAKAALPLEYRIEWHYIVLYGIMPRGARGSWIYFMAIAYHRNRDRASSITWYNSSSRFNSKAVVPEL